MPLGIEGVDFAAIFSPQFFKMLGLGLTIISLVVAAAAMGFLFYYILSYNVNIEYFDKRKSVNTLKKTTAKKIIEDGIPKLKIWMVKGSPLKLPDTEVVFKARGRDKVFMTRDFAGHFNYVEWGDKLDKTMLNEIKPEARLWESLQYKKNIQRFQKQGWWDKYGNMLIQYGFIVFVMFLLIMLFTKYQVVADKFGAVAKQLTVALKASCGTQSLG